jgi:type IV secretory pathway VirB10-like protein
MNSAVDIRKLFLGIGIGCLLLSTSVVLAQEDDASDADPAEATIRLMGAAETELPEAVTNEIKLPPAATENSAAVENAARGQQRAQENRERRENGLSRADEAREHGAEMAEQARQNRENRGRFEDRPTPPDRPEPPDPPRGPPGT